MSHVPRRRIVGVWVVIVVAGWFLLLIGLEW